MNNKYEVNLILSNVSKGRMSLDGDEIKVGRFEVYKKKGIKCVSCGIEAKYFKKETQLQNGEEIPYLVLYAEHNGKPIMMTRDHIIPVSRGGSNHVSNYQPMCDPCNQCKGNYIATKIKIKLSYQEFAYIPKALSHIFVRAVSNLVKIWSGTKSSLDR